MDTLEQVIQEEEYTVDEALYNEDTLIGEEHE